MGRSDKLLCFKSKRSPQHGQQKPVFMPNGFKGYCVQNFGTPPFGILMTCTVWDPHTQEHKHKIEMVQHRAARFACKDYSRKSSVTKMLAELEWDSLSLRRQAARLTMLHKIQTDQIAIQPSNFLTPVARPTRRNNSKSFLRPSANKNCYSHSFFPRTIAEWNCLPELTCAPTTLCVWLRMKCCRV